MRIQSRTLWIFAALLIVLGAVLGSVLRFDQRPVPGEILPVQAAEPARTSIDLEPNRRGYSSVLATATPAVVNIATTRLAKVNVEGIVPDDPFFRRFFGDRLPWGEDRPPEPERGLGSGVIVDADGYIVTNNHVVDSATEIRVLMSDQQDFKAKVIGTDAKTDLALLKIDAKDLPSLPLGDSSKAAVGDIVFAIGNPFGVGQTVTMGIVSAMGRGNLGIEDYEDFIQTDAAINPGNSGGALVDVEGRLVGINTAIIGRSGGSDGIGFAIPSSMVRAVVDQLREHGQVSRGLLGAVIQNVTPDLAKAFGLAEARGALVSSLTDDGPAISSGLKRGDVIVDFNHQAVPDARRLRLWVAATPPGTEVELRVMRGGKPVDLSVKLGRLSEPDQTQTAENATSTDAQRGLSVQNLTPDMRSALSLPSDLRGVAVAGVQADSPAARAGLRRGDVIEEVNRQPVNSESEWRQAMGRAGGDAVLLLVHRQGASLYVVVPAQ